MKRLEFEQIAQKVLEGTCEADEFSRLEAEINRSSEMRRVFRETFVMHGMLEQAAEDLASGPEETGKIVPIDTLLHYQRRRAVMVALSSAAAVIVGLAIALKLVVPEPPPALTVRHAPNTEWSVRTADRTPGDPSDLRPGDVIQVAAGTVEMQLGKGVEGIVQGPARVVIESESQLHMVFGSGRFAVPHGAEGFRVRSRRIDVVDLGTEFGLLVPENEAYAPEVHVFKGRVRASVIGGVREQREWVAGEAGRVTLWGSFEPIDLNPTHFFSALPDDLPHVRLSFDEGEADRFDLTGQHPSIADMKVRVNGRIEPVSGVRGKGIRFAEPASRVVTNWGGPLGDAPRTIAAWVRVPAERPYQRYQTVAGWGDPTIGLAGKCELLLMKMGPQAPTLARLSFDQFLFTGTTDLADGAWHHVAAVYEGPNGEVSDRVRLYVDGKEEALHPRWTEVGDFQSEPRTLEGGWPFVVGDLPLPGQTRTFQGELDEVVVFEAAIDEDRIKELARPGK